MGKIAPPTLISYTETAWDTFPDGGGNTKVSSSVSWLAGDIIVTAAGDTNQTTINVPTATGLTFSSIAGCLNVTNTCGTRLSSATAASDGSSAITVDFNAASSICGFCIWVWRGSVGIGTSIEQHTSTKTKALVPTNSNSAIVWATFDWGAGNLATITPTPSDTDERSLFSGQYGVYVSDLLNQTSAASVSYGVSGGSGTGPFCLIGVEIKGSTCAPSPTMTRSASIRSTRW